jgi:hypothetical protein
MGDEGDYVLSDFDLTQMPAAPDYQTSQGITSIKSAQIQGFSFSDYADEDWDDTEANERLVFLQQLSQ